MTHSINPRYFTYLIGVVFLLCALSFVVNLYYQFPGNNYVPKIADRSLLTLGLMLWGSWLLSGKNSGLTKIIQEILYFFLLMLIIALATNAVQFTPFPVIDNYILAAEHQLQIETLPLFTWTYQHPQIQHILAFAYGTLPWQMSILPIMVILSGKLNRLREYYFLMLSSTIIGFLIYYFFPTTAPASMLQSNYFSQEQFATSLKFNQIHQHILPTTLDGGLIAFPSFHVIWAWLCLYLVRSWLWIFIPLLLVNIVLVFACVLLGWHYFLDVVMSIVILLFSHFCMYRISNCKNK